MTVMLPPVRGRQLHGAERIQSAAESTALLEELSIASEHALAFRGVLREPKQREAHELFLSRNAHQRLAEARRAPREDLRHVVAAKISICEARQHSPDVLRRSRCRQH